MKLSCCSLLGSKSGAGELGPLAPPFDVVPRFYDFWVTKARGHRHCPLPLGHLRFRSHGVSVGGPPRRIRQRAFREGPPSHRGPRSILTSSDLTASATSLGSHPRPYRRP